MYLRILKFLLLVRTVLHCARKDSSRAFASKTIPLYMIGPPAARQEKNGRARMPPHPPRPRQPQNTRRKPPCWRTGPEPPPPPPSGRDRSSPNRGKPRTLSRPAEIPRPPPSDAAPSPVPKSSARLSRRRSGPSDLAARIPPIPPAAAADGIRPREGSLRPVGRKDCAEPTRNTVCASPPLPLSDDIRPHAQRPKSPPAETQTRRRQYPSSKCRQPCERKRKSEPHSTNYAFNVL